MYHNDYLDKIGHITFTLCVYYQTFISGDVHGSGVTNVKAAKWSTVFWICVSVFLRVKPQDVSEETLGHFQPYLW